MTKGGAGPEPGPDPTSRRALDHVDAAARSTTDALRSRRRVRILRGVLLSVAVVLLLAVAWEIWSHRPRRKSSAPAPLEQAENALQSLDKFDYKATEKGRLLYRIIADKLVGVEGGLHTLQGIRSAEITLSDGRVLRGRADHGSLMEGPKDPKGAGRHGHLVLEGDVTVDSDLGDHFESDRLDYFQAESKLLSPGRCTFRLAPAAKEEPSRASSRIGPSSGEAGSAEYQLEAKTILLSSGVVLHLSSEGSSITTATASHARIAADGSTADLEGDARIVRDDEFLSAPRIQLERSDGGDRTHVVAGPGVRGRIVSGAVRASSIARDEQNAGTKAVASSPAQQPVKAAAVATEGSRPSGASRPTILSGQTLDSVELASSGQRSVTLSGDASVEDAPVPGLPAGRALTARTIVVHEGGGRSAAGGGNAASGNGSRTLHAADDVRVEFPPAEGEADRRVLTCRTLDAVAAADGTLTTADADGSVTVRSGARRASSARAHMVGETQAELRGGRPVVEEPDRRVVADEIDVATKPSRLTARGSVQTRFVPAAKDKPEKPDGASNALPFTPGVPVDVLSDAALMKETEKTAEFTGHVRARQSDRALSATKLFVNDADKTARAEGAVTVRTFREESPPKAATSPDGSKAATAVTTPPGAVVRVPVQVDADTLFHDDAHRTTRFEGHVVYREPGRRLTADRITLEGGSAGSPATTLAEGHVVYEGEGKRGTGDTARHASADKTVTLEGRERPAQVVETASGRSWRGPSLTWVQAADSIPVVTGTSGRSRIVGSTGSQRDDVGKPTVRGKPR